MSLPLPDGDYWIKSAHSDLHWELKGGTTEAETPVIVSPPDKAARQKWQLVYKASIGLYSIRSAAANAYVNYQPHAGRPVIIAGSYEAHWAVLAAGPDKYGVNFPQHDGWISIRPDQDQKGTQLFLPPARGVPDQTWTFEPA